MTLYKFGKNDIFHNRIKAHPKINFKIYNQQVFYNNQQDISGALNASPGYIDLYEFTNPLRTLPPPPEEPEGAANPQQHGLEHNPVALWQLDGNLLDSSGNGNHLALVTGLTTYTDLHPGLKGFHFDAATTIGMTGTAAILQITGAITVEFLMINGEDTVSSTDYIIAHVGTGSTSADNYLYSVRLDADQRLGYLAETGSGTDITFQSDAVVGSSRLLHVAMVRDSSGSVQFYLNGENVTSSFAARELPSDGSLGRIRMGADRSNANDYLGALASVKIIPLALTQDEVRDEFARTIGNVI